MRLVTEVPRPPDSEGIGSADGQGADSPAYGRGRHGSGSPSAVQEVEGLRATAEGLLASWRHLSIHSRSAALRQLRQVIHDLVMSPGGQTAEPYCERAARLAAEARDHDLWASALLDRAQCRNLIGDRIGSREYIMQASALEGGHQLAGEIRARIHHSRAMASISALGSKLFDSNVAPIEAELREAMGHYQSVGDDAAVGCVLAWYGLIQLVSGRLEDADVSFAKGKELVDSGSHDEVTLYLHVALRYELTQDLAAALAALDEAARICEQGSWVEYLVEVERRRGRVLAKL